MRIPPDSEAGDRANTRAVMLQTSGKQQGEASMARLAGVDIPREKARGSLLSLTFTAWARPVLTKPSLLPA